MHYLITGYYGKQNLGDMLFEELAHEIFTQVQKHTYTVVPIDCLLTATDGDGAGAGTGACAYDALVLFGGETLNDYFLDIILRFRAQHMHMQSRPMHMQSRPMPMQSRPMQFFALGVSCNQAYADIFNKVQVFDKIIFRALADYTYFKPFLCCDYAPDLIFYKKFQKTAQAPTRSSLLLCRRPLPLVRVGFFLANTVFAHQNAKQRAEILAQLCLYVRVWLDDPTVAITLFAMSNNPQNTEDDRLINAEVFALLTTEEKARVHLVACNADILSALPLLHYAVCWRFHAHVLSIMHQIPFVSISATPKVRHLLEETGLQMYAATPKTFAFVSQVLQQSNYKEMQQKLKKITKSYRWLTRQTFGTPLTLTCVPSGGFYMSSACQTQWLNAVAAAYVQFDFHTAEDKARLILFILLRSVHSPALYGLTCAIANKPDLATKTHEKRDILETLKPNIDWLLYDLRANPRWTRCFYETAKLLLDFPVAPPALQPLPLQPLPLKYNFTYIDPYEYQGLHRAGWSYVVDHLLPYSHSTPDAILCDLYLDSTFHWHADKYKKLRVIPYRQPWVGFIHHTLDTFYSEANTVRLFQNPEFRASLEVCRGLFVLSAHLQEGVEALLQKFTPSLNIRVRVLTHPTLIPDNKFTMKKFHLNKEKKMVQIGAWMRNMSAINDVHVEEVALKRAALKGKNMQGYFVPNETISPSISRALDFKHVCLASDVLLLEHLEDAAYDDLLSCNIVFLNLVGASAVNTIIECIVRDTPLVVNRLPATLEALGETYPLFYDKLSDVSNLVTLKNIAAAHKYLKKLDKSRWQINTFLEGFFL